MLTRYTCRRCYHQWVPNKETPKRCPKCQRKDWNPYPVHDREQSLTETESLALTWIAEVNNIPISKVFKQIGSPDFVLENGKSYEVKSLGGRAVHISENQRSFILEHNPNCELLIFKSGNKTPILSIPVSSIVSGKMLNTVDISKYGQIYIRIS